MAQKRFHDVAFQQQIKTLKYITENWGTVSSKEMEVELDLVTGSVNGIANRLRKASIPLKHLRPTSILADAKLVQELKELYQNTH